MLKWTRDERKARENLQHHRIDSTTAKSVIENSLSEIRVKLFESELRWQTMGKLGPVPLVAVQT